MRRDVITAFCITAALRALVSFASELPAPIPATNPIPELNFATTVLPPTPCSADPNNAYEQALYTAQGWTEKDGAGNLLHYSGTDCQRLHFKFGPILVKPGQNDVLIQPVTIEKPAYDGYIVRFKPDLIRAEPNGTFDVPPIEEVHLHHATWLALTNTYGSGPFSAAGEEKTLFNAPRGYGFPVAGLDQWQFLYMVHNLTSTTYVVWVTYDTDFISKASGDRQNIKPIYPIWLDVRNGSYYPVFNVQRGFGSPPSLPFVDPNSCTWPLQNCANFDPWGNVTPGQGQPPTSLGNDAVQLPPAGGSVGKIQNFQGGTIVWIGGHLHPGGLSDDIELVRNGAAMPIFRSEAQYWDYADPTKVTTDVSKFVSWDMSMTVTGLPYWGIKVKPGDIIRINGTYDNTVQSSYENMGIAVAMLSPDPSTPGIDPFDTASPPTIKLDTSSTDLSTFSSCGPAANALCQHGYVTHGHLKEAADHSGPSGGLKATSDLPAINTVTIAEFTFAPGSADLVNSTGAMPTVKLGDTLSFVNLDSAADIYHTVTSCAYPCQGVTGTAFPLSNGQGSNGTKVDFDSSELGFGPSFGPAKNAATWGLAIDPAKFKACETYTYFCRIHPFMRGAFKVVPADGSQCP